MNTLKFHCLPGVPDYNYYDTNESPDSATPKADPTEPPSESGSGIDAKTPEPSGGSDSGDGTLGFDNALEESLWDWGGSVDESLDSINSWTDESLPSGGWEDIDNTIGESSWIWESNVGSSVDTFSSGTDESLPFGAWDYYGEYGEDYDGYY